VSPPVGVIVFPVIAPTYACSNAARINITVNGARQIAHVLEIGLSELFRGIG
jgi:hypothetical protein